MTRRIINNLSQSFNALTENPISITQKIKKELETLTGATDLTGFKEGVDDIVKDDKRDNRTKIIHLQTILSKLVRDRHQLALLLDRVSQLPDLVKRKNLRAIELYLLQDTLEELNFFSMQHKMVDSQLQALALQAKKDRWQSKLNIVIEEWKTVNAFRDLDGKPCVTDDDRLSFQGYCTFQDDDEASLRHAEGIVSTLQHKMKGLNNKERYSLTQQWKKVESIASKTQKDEYNKLINPIGYTEKKAEEISGIIQSVKNDFRTLLQTRITEVSQLDEGIAREDKIIQETEKTFSTNSALKSYSATLNQQIGNAKKDIKDITKEPSIITGLRQDLENAKKKDKIIALPTEQDIKTLEGFLTEITEKRTKAMKNMDEILSKHMPSPSSLTVPSLEKFNMMGVLYTMQGILNNLEESTDERIKKYRSGIQWGTQSKKREKLEQAVVIKNIIQDLKTAVGNGENIANLQEQVKHLQGQMAYFKIATSRTWCCLFKSGATTKNEDKYIKDFEQQKKALDAELRSVSPGK